MDRRLPFRPGPYAMQQGRRNLYVEQRLYTDLLGGARRRTQRYLNPPCSCVADPGLVLLGIGPDDVILGATAAYTFTAPVTASLISFAGDAPADDGRGWGIEITVSHNGTPFSVGTLTGAAATDSASVSEAFATSDEITFEVTDMSTGTATGITVDVTFDGTQEAFVAWDIPA